jgi:hypothetical protein
MGNNHGVVAAAVPTFPVALYVLRISYLVLVMVPFAGLLDVLACIYVVKLASDYVLLTLIIKLTRKLLNILTISPALAESCAIPSATAKTFTRDIKP